MTPDIFPAVTTILAGTALIEGALSQYALDEITTCDLHAVQVNDTYHARAGSSSYYLRVYTRGWRELHDIESEVELLNRLRALDVSVAYPIATRNGEYIVSIDAMEGVRHAVLFPAAEGKSREITDHWSSEFGRVVGHLHVSMDRIPTPFNRFHLDHEHTLDAPLRSAEPLLAHRRRDYDYLLDISQQLRARVDELLPKESPEYGLCHGDLHLGNIHFQDDGTHTLFDFDCFGYGWRAYDLAGFLSTLEASKWDKTAKANRTRLWNRFLKGYEEHRTLSDAEREAVNVFVPISDLWSMGLHAGWVARRGRGWCSDESFDLRIKTIKEWIDYYKVL